jgi:signal transduction histidine kinase
MTVVNTLSASNVELNRLEAEDAARALENIQASLAAQAQGLDSATADLRNIIADLHPADLAYVLEGLPLEERQIGTSRTCHA